MSGLLADLYSAGDRMKRKLGGLLSNPLETIALGSTRMAEDTNALTRLVSEAGYMPNTVNRADQSVLVSERQKALARALLADKGAEMGMAAATVWHGSPHKFDKFDSSKIGTGEGAQAYGHGLYLAESPEVAKSYQTALSAERGFSFGGKTGLTRAQVEDMANAKYGGGYLDGVIRPSGVAGSFIDDMVTGVSRPPGFYPRQYKPGSERARLYDELRGQITHADPGSLYKVDLPDNAIARMLDWDKPLSQQAPEVQAAIRKTRGMLPPNALDDLGGDLSLLYGKNVGASDFLGTMNSLRPNLGETLLQKAGVPGVRYLDGGSRGAGQGSSNYVIFPQNEGLLTILERNGVPIK